MEKRIIGTYQGDEKGPLFIAFGSMHGNEPAGVKALDIMFKMLEVEPITNPDFHFKGRFIGLRGNLRAIAANKRFIKRDLNRQWTVENIAKAKRFPEFLLDSEERELKEIISLIEQEIETYQPEKIVVLDLHTTTAEGGIFSISTDDEESVRIAIDLHAPVIKGMLNSISGTTLHYFNKENFHRDIVTITFESGQHEDPLSVNRAIAAITSCMRTIGCVKANDVEHRHDDLLIEYSRTLPKVAELITCHHIQPGDGFEMKPGFLNFQKVTKGEVLARDKNGIIRAEVDGHLLMPLYQKQGEDGFFLIRELEGF